MYVTSRMKYRRLYTGARTYGIYIERGRVVYDRWGSLTLAPIKCMCNGGRKELYSHQRNLIHVHCIHGCGKCKCRSCYLHLLHHRKAVMTSIPVVLDGGEGPRIGGVCHQAIYLKEITRIGV